MKNIYIINGHEPYDFSSGALNKALIRLAEQVLSELNYNVASTRVSEPWDVDAEIEAHLWADAVLVQFPVNWMSVPWSLKRYMDIVYTKGIGTLCSGDGRSRDDASLQYGSGGLLGEKKYMLSATFNAPQGAFNNPEAFFFSGKSVDDLFWPVHLTYKFMAMQPLPTFACYDVMKNPQIEADFEGFNNHLLNHFPCCPNN